MTKTTKKTIKWVVIVLTLLLLCFVIYQHFNSKSDKPNYITAPVSRGDIEKSVMATGKVKAIQTVDVGSQASGEVTTLYVKIGDEVKKGDLIAQIDQVTQKNALSNSQASLTQSNAALEQARAELASRQGDAYKANTAINARVAELTKAQTNLARIKSLLDSNAVSKQEYDDAVAATKVAQANLDEARANLKNAQNAIHSAAAAISSQQAAVNKSQNDVNNTKEDLAHTTIRAPMDGTVVSITTKQGQTVNANQSAPTIVTLADLSRIRINAQISEADVINVKKGMTARFNIVGDSEHQFDTILAGIEPAPETISTTSATNAAVYYIGYLDVDNAERKFRIDMTAQINIIIDRVKNVLTIPSAAIQTDEHGKTTVKVLNKTGEITNKPVVIGLNNRVNAEVKSGLAIGDQVILGESTNKPKEQDNGPPPNL